MSHRRHLAQRPSKGPAVAILGLLVGAIAVVAAGDLRAADWPQILGPNRDGSTTETLPDRFADGGPVERWRRDVGEGMSGVAVAHGTVVLFHRVDDVERVEAIAARDGETLWTHGQRVTYRGGILADSGPRTVPLVATLPARGQRPERAVVVVLGVAGGLRTLDLETGELLWSTDLRRRYAVPEGYFGIGTTPLVAPTADGPVLVVNVGADGHGVVGFDLATGEVRWIVAGEVRASYSTPVLATVDGAPQVVVPTRLETLGLDPASGAVRWRFPFGQRGPSVVAAVPQIVDRDALPVDPNKSASPSVDHPEDDLLLLTAAYGVGASLLDLDRVATETPTPPSAPSPVLWSTPELSSHYPSPVVLGGHVYGIDGREDHGTGRLRCLDLATGTVRWSLDRWSDDTFGMAHLLTDGTRLLVQRLDGTLLLVEPDPTTFRVLDQAKIPRTKTPLRALPAFSDGVLYLRTTPDRGGGELIALRLR